MEAVELAHESVVLEAVVDVVVVKEVVADGTVESVVVEAE